MITAIACLPACNPPLTHGPHAPAAPPTYPTSPTLPCSNIVAFYGCGWSKEAEEQDASGDAVRMRQLFFLQVRCVCCNYGAGQGRGRERLDLL